jgi:exonuclease SbcC
MDISVRMELDIANERCRLLMNAQEMLEHLAALHKNLEENSTSIFSLRAGHKKIQYVIREVSGNRLNFERKIQNIEKQVLLLSRIRDLEEDRKHLADGTPCPLCGSIDHPYAHSNLSQLNITEEALRKLKVEFKKQSVLQSKLKAAHAKNEAEAHHIEKNITEKKAALEKDETQYAAILCLLEFSADVKEHAKKSGKN